MSTTYTADEVHALLYAAYERGRYDADINDLRGTWAEMDEPKATREQRVQARMAEMEAAGRRRAEYEGRPYREYRGGPVDWETGATIPHELRVAA